MPERLYVFDDQGDIGTTATPSRVVAINRRLRLRPLDTFTQTRYDRLGKRLGAIVDLAELKAEAISELYGFHANFDENGGTVAFQISTDGGATFLRWNSSAWVADGLFSSWEDIDRGFQSLPLPSPKRIKVRIKIDPELGGKRGPEIATVSLFYELRYEWQKDLLVSLKHHLESKVTFAAVTAKDFALTDPTRDRVSIDAPITPVLPVRAYNLTSDPGRVTNIATGVSGQAIVFNANQTGRVEAHFRGKPPIYLTADSDFERSESEAVLIEVTSVRENEQLRETQGKVDFRRADRKARVRPQPAWENADLRIQTQSSRKAEAEAMVEALAEVLQYGATFASEATGETFTVKGFAPVVVGDVIGVNLYVREATLRVTGRHWLQVPYNEVPLAEEISLDAYQIRSDD